MLKKNFSLTNSDESNLEGKNVDSLENSALESKSISSYYRFAFNYLIFFLVDSKNGSLRPKNSIFLKY